MEDEFTGGLLEFGRGVEGRLLGLGPFETLGGELAVTPYGADIDLKFARLKKCFSPEFKVAVFAFGFGAEEVESRVEGGFLGGLEGGEKFGVLSQAGQEPLFGFGYKFGHGGFNHGWTQMDTDGESWGEDLLVLGLWLAA